ncbi:MAG: HAMP domain-containing histidine kinase [Chloroflexi bacterium]|nr:MAG: HAMP domain-containing histidine kinase [Chloroflexota bacterium]
MSAVAAVLALALAIGAAVLLTELTMSPSWAELRKLAIYLALAGVASAGLGWVALRGADRMLGPGLRGRAFLSSVIAGAVALLNVIIVGQLMFVSTEHDLNLLLTLVIFSAVITAFFSFSVAATVAGRIENIAAAIRLLAHGAFATRLAPNGNDEVARLSEDVDLLAARLQAADDQRAALDRERRELTAAISHDLRTPLASLRAMTEALNDGIVDEPAEIRRYYATMRREIERLSGMIDDLFELSQLDAGALKLERLPICVQDIAAEVVDAMQAAARLAGVELILNVDSSPPEIEVDGGRIERAIGNLVRNALEHTPGGGRVLVSVAATNGNVDLRVADSGSGIAPSDLPHVWERFYRADTSRGRNGNGDGAGLGLAITRGIVEAHGGSVEAISGGGDGATFVLRLPLS